MRILGIDYGQSRIGLALSDPFGWTAQGLNTIHWKSSLNKPLAEILRVINEYSVDMIVVGYPKNMNGTIGESGKKTEVFVEALQKLVPTLRIHLWDERLTTVAAQRVMRETGAKTINNKGLADKIAAIYILQGFLDSQRLKK